MNQLLTLGEVLTNDAIPFDHHLCLPEGVDWNGDTRCAIVESDELSGPEEHPLAVAHKLICTIGTNEVQDIIFNAKAQLPEASADKLLEAFCFYFDNDAFIEFENQE
ncbi:MAG TPA: hypothetical protein VFB96_02365 [Pirellulaceae bacterium]|nr:hypothetical protein [Pirellulaceae bacterium]